jgi:hypothetical protein
MLPPVSGNGSTLQPPSAMALVDRDDIGPEESVRHLSGQPITRRDPIIEHLTATCSRVVPDCRDGTIEIRQLLAHVAEVGVPTKQVFDSLSQLWKSQPSELSADCETILGDHGNDTPNSTVSILRMS